MRSIGGLVLISTEAVVAPNCGVSEGADPEGELWIHRWISVPVLSPGPGLWVVTEGIR